MAVTVFANATLVLPDRLLPGELASRRRADSRRRRSDPAPVGQVIDLGGMYLAPGFVDLHVHGGDGADFMDGTAEAFRTVCRCHARHGTTSLTPTSTVARMDQYLRFLDLCGELYGDVPGGARIVGSHFYGPYFARPARGCHPDQDFLTPNAENAEAFTKLAAKMPLSSPSRRRSTTPSGWCGPTPPAACGSTPGTATPRSRRSKPRSGGACGTSITCSARCPTAPGCGSRRPTRCGPALMEATLFFDELTTEVIADGKHLTPELLRLAYKVKGPDRLALVTDSMRAVDLPDGEYWFGAEGTGERVRKLDGVGVTLGRHRARVRRDGDGSLRPHDAPHGRRAAAGSRADGEPDAGAHSGRGSRDRQPGGRQACGLGGAGRGVEREAGVRRRRAGRVNEQAHGTAVRVGFAG